MFIGKFEISIVFYALQIFADLQKHRLNGQI